MCSQRVGVAENLQCQFIKWTAEGVVKGINAEYSTTQRHTSVVRNMLVFRKCVMFTKQGGTAVYEDYIVLDRVKSVKDFFMNSGVKMTQNNIEHNANIVQDCGNAISMKQSVEFIKLHDRLQAMKHQF